MDGMSFTIGFSVGGLLLLAIIVAIAWAKLNERF